MNNLSETFIEFQPVLLDMAGLFTFKAEAATPLGLEQAGHDVSVG
jgi:hypothetical protein